MEKVREEEPLQRDKGADYEGALKRYAEARERARTGKIVIRTKDLPWRQNRMGYIKSYLSWNKADTAVEDWTCFIHDIKFHSGKHRHQGGIMLFVLEGEGYTVVNGEKVEWEKGDLIILPVLPNGCEHQHFNKTPGKPARWMAFLYSPFFQVLGNLFQHVENSPDWKGQKERAA
jgi:mannose-6-phosphate isomerase-like protein (cupin superfamily)